MWEFVGASVEADEAMSNVGVAEPTGNAVGASISGVRVAEY